MKKCIFLAIALLFISSLSVIFAEENITFQLMRGRAALNRQGVGNWLDLGPEPIVVRIQDRLRTEGETRGEIKYPDGSVFRVKSNSILTLLDSGIQLQVGEALFNLQKQGRTFQVVTPTAVCGVLGTSFDVNVDRFGKTQVRVFNGIVGVKTHGQERRQLVLQRGMMTQVQRAGSLDTQPQRFDAGKLEKEQTKEGNSTTSPMKYGPERPALPTGKPGKEPGKSLLPPPPEILRDGDGRGLPPIRQENPKEGLPPLRGANAGFRPIDPRPTGPENNPGIRENMNFFDSLQRQQRPLPREGAGPQPGSQPGPQPGQGQGSFGRPGLGFTPDQMKEGHGQSFGQAGPGLSGMQDKQRLRDELALVQSQIDRLNSQIKQVTAELAALREQLARANQQNSALRANLARQQANLTPLLPGALPSTPVSAPTTLTGMTPQQIQERLQQLENTLRGLREQQQILIIRLNDLRSRLY